MRGLGVFLSNSYMDNLLLNRMNSRQGIVKKNRELYLEYHSVVCVNLKFVQEYNFDMRLFFLTIPKPLRQHPV
jgi:hypothetical protein